jgi:hypothetical protein
MPPEPLRTLRTLHAQHRHRDCAALALRYLSSVDPDASTAAAPATSPETTTTETTNDSEPPTNAAGADAKADATTTTTLEPLHRAALALYAALSLDALARSAPLRSAAAAARAARAAELFARAAAVLQGAYGAGDVVVDGQLGDMIAGRAKRERERGGEEECRSGRMGGWEEGGEVVANGGDWRAETARGRWQARAERFRQDVAEFVDALEALGRSADRWRNKVLDWQERHGVVVRKEDLAAGAWDLHGVLW